MAGAGAAGGWGCTRAGVVTGLLAGATGLVGAESFTAGPARELPSFFATSGGSRSCAHSCKPSVWGSLPDRLTGKKLLPHIIWRCGGIDGSASLLPQVRAVPPGNPVQVNRSAMLAPHTVRPLPDALPEVGQRGAEDRKISSQVVKQRRRLRLTGDDQNRIILAQILQGQPVRAQLFPPICARELLPRILAPLGPR